MLLKSIKYPVVVLVLSALVAGEVCGSSSNSEDEKPNPKPMRKPINVERKKVPEKSEQTYTGLSPYVHLTDDELFQLAIQEGDPYN